MEEVKTAEKRVSDYRTIIGKEALAELLELGSKLKGKRVAHVNATPYGGGVAELLHSVVPLMRDLGLDVRWFVLSGTPTFFDVTKAMHNALQGAPIKFTPDMRAEYLRVNEENASDFLDEFDFVVIHDPQPAPFVSLVERKGAWIWRCHIDLTAPSHAALSMIADHVAKYEGCIFSMRAYAPPDVPIRRTYVAPPGIDPLSPKSRPVSDAERAAVLSRYDVDPDRPTINQVGRFDPWKDPLGVIDAYRLVKARVPDVQLLMIGSMAKDDPEGWTWFERTVRHAGEDPDIRFLTDLVGVGALDVNVLQRASHVALAKSLREGFGLVVSESLWKEVPVIGGNVGGIALQLEGDHGGFLVSSVEQAAARTLELLRDEKRRHSMGEAGRERVREHFLITRYVRDYLRIFRETCLSVGA